MFGKYKLQGKEPPAGGLPFSKRPKLGIRRETSRGEGVLDNIENEAVQAPAEGFLWNMASRERSPRLKAFVKRTEQWQRGLFRIILSTGHKFLRKVFAKQTKLCVYEKS